MALKNITNTKIDLLFNRQQQHQKKTKDFDSNQIFIEQLPCSPSRLKYNKLPQHLPKMDQYPPKGAYVRTSSPITSPMKPHHRLNQPQAPHPLTVHPELRLSKRPPLPTLKKATSQTSSSNSQHFSSKNASGMLKVALYNNHGLLTVHVIQARGLRLPQVPDLRCDSYVRVTMLPDPEQRLKCQTAIIKDTSNPIFDEKFSFEFGEDDYSNRIAISVWNRAASQFNCGGDVLIGCFSFKIKHLMKRESANVCSWYYLLPTAELGSKKHYKVKQSRSYQLEQQQKHLTQINKDIIGLEKINLVINRGETGFGFTVTGSCPCIVGKVDPEKEAFAMGLRPGDYIVKIKEQNVSRGTCESVVKMIKACKSRLHIEVHREKSTSVANPEQLYFSNEQPQAVVRQPMHVMRASNSYRSAFTDTTTSDFSGKSIELPQYNLHHITTNTATTATTATTDDMDEDYDQVEFDDEDDDDEEEFFNHQVTDQVEIPYVDEDSQDEKENKCFLREAKYYRNTIGHSRNVDCVLVKNEARTRMPILTSAVKQNANESFSMITSSNGNDVVYHQQYANFI